MPGLTIRWLTSVAISLLVVGCTRGEEQPRDLAPTLVVVTATPGIPAPPALRTAATRYTVRAGDSLSSIAERHDVTEAAILRANNLTDPNRIDVGQELIIPPPEP